MGKIKQGILGGFSGTVGTVIGGNWKGVDYMRGKAASYSDKKSEAQLEQRAKFSLISKFLAPMSAYLQVTFAKVALKRTGINAAFSYNIANAITGTYPAFDVDFSKVLVSKGTLPGALNPEVTSTTAGEIEYSWENNSTDTNASATDKATLLVYNPVKNKVVTVIGGNTRIGGSQSVTLPSNFTGDEVQCYIAFQKENTSTFSKSEFAGGIIVS